tara:strand:+ start:200 stop:880 length:681 start_codon:yes stop_codon:yes gene_type:complete
MEKGYVKLLKDRYNSSDDVIYNIYNTKDFINDGSLTRLLNLDNDFKNADINLYKINSMELPLTDLTWLGVTEGMWSSLVKYKKNGFKFLGTTDIYKLREIIIKTGLTDKYWNDINDYDRIDERKDIIDKFKSLVFPWREDADLLNFGKKWISKSIRWVSCSPEWKYRVSLGDDQCIACLLYTDENEIEIKVNKAREYLKNELESNGFKFSEDIFDGFKSFYDLRKK